MKLMCNIPSNSEQMIELPAVQLQRKLTDRMNFISATNQFFLTHLLVLRQNWGGFLEWRHNFRIWRL